MDKVFLNTLAKEILALLPRSISKVKFAKVIYFCFKDLVVTNYQDTNKIAFIRMPLGPVPDGFMDLEVDKEIIITQESVGLTYDRQNYALAPNTIINLPEYSQRLKTFVSELDNLATSTLVTISHKEPSWLSLPNGQSYYISLEDLKLPLPQQHRNTTNLSDQLDQQLLQARLINGMKLEIVQDNTALEYPDNPDVF
ncbi:MAG: hypothetical protein A3A82_00430 [Candidatus Pacebacteria bacterium RIFCSPLOWO2_01_FULL_47_12]|nr:MAG: hypothetical protein A3A82_00430 [Candidatus Pacebacteria bacterium RIFCSPLOWO2_01_FULL_47_12]